MKLRNIRSLSTSPVIIKHIRILLIVLFTAAAVSAQGSSPKPEAMPFLMSVEDAFVITGRGVVVSGRIERGVLKVGDAVEIIGKKPTKATTVTGIQVFRKTLTEAKAGDDVGVFLSGIAKEDIVRGQVIAKPGSIKPYTKFKAKIDLLAATDGGRSAPITDAFRPMIYARTGMFSAVIKLPKAKRTIAPGEKGVEVEITVTEPAALEKGQLIAIREGSKTIGSGTITALLQ